MFLYCKNVGVDGNKNMLPKYRIKWGSYGIKIPWNKGTFTENVGHDRKGKKQSQNSKCYCRLGKTASPPYLQGAWPFFKAVLVLLSSSCYNFGADSIMQRLCSRDRGCVYHILDTIHPEIFTNEFPAGFFFCNFYGNSLRPPIFSVTPMRSSGSRVDWKIFFVIFTKLIPRKNFFCIANILVLMVFLKPVWPWPPNKKCLKNSKLNYSSRIPEKYSTFTLSGWRKPCFWQTLVLSEGHPPFSSFSSVSGLWETQPLVFVGRM